LLLAFLSNVPPAKTLAENHNQKGYNQPKAVQLLFPLSTLSTPSTLSTGQLAIPVTTSGKQTIQQG
jgi:hypothetical protein